MTEIHCPACSALLNLSVNLSGPDSGDFATKPVPRSQSASDIREKERLAGFNAALADVLREFLAVHPWEGFRLPGDIQAEFIAWLRAAPEDRDFYRFLRPQPVTKNRISKLLVSEIGATFIKGPKGREYRLPESLQPAGGDGSGPAAGADLAGEGSLVVEGVASRPLAEHIAKVREQAAAEDAVAPVSLYEQERALRPNTVPSRMPPADYMFVTKDGVKHKVPIKSRGDVAAPPKEEVMDEPADYSLPEGTVVDGPSVIPVAEPEGGWAPPPTRKWGMLISDAEADLEPAELEMLFMQRLPDNLLLQGAVDVEYRAADGAPVLLGLVASLDGSEPGEYSLPAPVVPPPAESQVFDSIVAEYGADVVEEARAADGSVAVWDLDRIRDRKIAEAEAAAVPLPSQAELAAVAGHEALERARTAAGAAAPVFLAPEDLDDYEGADPGDWG